MIFRNEPFTTAEKTIDPYFTKTSVKFASYGRPNSAVNLRTVLHGRPGFSTDLISRPPCPSTQQKGRCIKKSGRAHQRIGIRLFLQVELIQCISIQSCATLIKLAWRRQGTDWPDSRSQHVSNLPSWIRSLFRQAKMSWCLWLQLWLSLSPSRFSLC